MDTTKTIEVTFPDKSAQDLEIAIYYGKSSCDLIMIYNDKIYRRENCYDNQFAKEYLKNIPEKHHIYDANVDWFKIQVSTSQTRIIRYFLKYDPDENDEIKTYIREHGLFEETNEYILK